MIQEPLRRRCLSLDDEAGPEKIPDFDISWGKRYCYFFAHWLNKEYAKILCPRVYSKLPLGEHHLQWNQWETATDKITHVRDYLQGKAFTSWLKFLEAPPSFQVFLVTGPPRWSLLIPHFCKYAICVICFLQWHFTWKGQVWVITTNKASLWTKLVEMMEFQLSYFKPLKDFSVKVLHSICQQIWKTQQWPQDWKRSAFIRISKKGNAKECSTYCTIVLISHASKEMIKILQARLQQYMNCELPDVQAGFRKGRETRGQIANIRWIIKKESSTKTSISAY